MAKRKEPDSPVPDDGPAGFVSTLGARGVTLRTDGQRVWSFPKAALTEDEYRFAAKHNDALVALATPAPEKDADAPVDQPGRPDPVLPGE